MKVRKIIGKLLVWIVYSDGHKELVFFHPRIYKTASQGTPVFSILTPTQVRYHRLKSRYKFFRNPKAPFFSAHVGPNPTSVNKSV